MEKNIDTQLDELKAITEKMSDKSIGIEESVELFEKGILMAKDIESKLKEAELKITMLEGADNE